MCSRIYTEIVEAMYNMPQCSSVYQAVSFTMQPKLIFFLISAMSATLKNK